MSSLLPVLHLFNNDNRKIVDFKEQRVEKYNDMKYAYKDVLIKNSD